MLEEYFINARQAGKSLAALDDAARNGVLLAVADELETITAKDYWPFPTYTDLLYSVN